MDHVYPNNFGKNYPNICSLKEAGGKSTKVSETICALDDDFVVLSGDDGLTLPFMACGAKGVISVASNIMPNMVSHLVTLAAEAKFEEALSSNEYNVKLKKKLYKKRLFRKKSLIKNPLLKMNTSEP